MTRRVLPRLPGLTQIMILRMVAAAPPGQRYGYAIALALTEAYAVAGWSISGASCNTAMRRMVAHGWIKPVPRPAPTGRLQRGTEEVHFELTAAGREALALVERLIAEGRA